VSTILNWILKRVTFRLYNSSTPIGRRLGGHNIPDVVDSYLILELSIAGITAFTGYFQTS
jgi:hypothetical protein